VLEIDQVSWQLNLLQHLLTDDDPMSHPVSNKLAAKYLGLGTTSTVQAVYSADDIQPKRII
jgi:hypothetical protein